MSIFGKIFHWKSTAPTCEQVSSFLAEYIEGTLAEEMQAEFRSHLDKCPMCIAHFKQYQTTIRLVREESSVPIPDKLVEHTLDFLKERLNSE